MSDRSVNASNKQKTMNEKEEEIQHRNTKGQQPVAGIGALFAAIGPTCSAVRVLMQLRREFTETVTRREVNMNLFGAAMAALRKDSRKSSLEIAAAIHTTQEKIIMFESGLGGLDINQQVEYINALNL